MTKSFDFSEVEFFTVGTLGPRGERAFFLQGRASGELVSLKVEKQQVSALADYLDQVLEDLPEVEQEPFVIGVADLDLREPVVPAFTVGGLGVAYARDEDRLVVMAEELLETDDLALRDAIADAIADDEPKREPFDQPKYPSKQRPFNLAKYVTK